VVSTRRGLLAGGIAGGGALLAGCGTEAAPSPRDADLLARPLSAERSLIAAYEAIGGRLARRIAVQERAHAGRLERAIRAAGGPRGGARTREPGLVEGLDGALELERRAIAAYLDVLPSLRDPALRGLVAGLLTSDAQHVAVVLAALGRDPLPDAFAQGGAA
jgi:hypothetical protein